MAYSRPRPGDERGRHHESAGRVDGGLPEKLVTSRVVIPLPSQDFEPTAVAAPWRVLRDGGVEVVFATPDGKPGSCDPLALEGAVFKRIGSTPANTAIYREMEADTAFRNPIRYDAIEVEDHMEAGEGLEDPAGRGRL